MRFLSLLVLFGFFGCSSLQQKESGDEPPEANRFTQKMLIDGLDEPMQMDFDDEGRIFWIERTGAVKSLDEVSGQVTTLASLSVHRNPGLIGLLLDKYFETTRHIYIYYSAAEDEGSIMRLSRFTLGTDHKIEIDSEVEMLRIPWEQPDGTHIGGGMVWDADDNLYLSIGDCTAPSEYAPLAFTNPGGRGQDAARTAGNTNDLRGSIIRIHPQPDGSYTIPEGNLFEEGTPDTRPEIFVMGNRNPWRLFIDSKTGYLHWGDVGPDAGVDSTGRGPRGHDEFNVAREAGNFGWPFVFGNQPYNRYDYETETYGKPYDPEALVNESPNNTGLRELPPAQPALIAYPYGVSEEWPILSSGARSAVGGPVFQQADFAPDAPRVFPSYYEDKWFITDYVRNWIMVVTMNEKRTEALSIEPLLPPRDLSHSQPLDMVFGPTGDLYLIEYGVGSTGSISKIEYNAGNRAPVAKAGSDLTAGAVPFQTRLSSEGTVDYDGDELSYEWVVTPQRGGESLYFTEANPVVTFEQEGVYQVELTVSDPYDETDSDAFQIVAGNERPEIRLNITGGNRSFYFPDSTIEYEVLVTDFEDGSLSDGGIEPENVIVTAEYLSTDMTTEQVAGLQSSDEVRPGSSLGHIQAQELISEHNCGTCHSLESRSIGPSFTEIAEKNKGVGGAADELTKSVIEGSYGVWGETTMPPHPALPEAEVRQITEYILSLAEPDDGPGQLPLQGGYTTEGYEADPGTDRLGNFFTVPYQRGTYVLQASYTDKGSEETEGLQLTGDDLVVLRYPLLAPETADVISDGITFTPSTNDPGFIINGREGFIGFKDIDLTGISKINIGALTRFWHWTHFIGATIELRLGSPTGRLIGDSYEREPPPPGTEGPFFGEDLDSPVPVDVSEVEDVHDVYIVVQNPNAGDNDALLIMTGIEFEQ